MSENKITHNLDYGVIFPKNGSGTTGIQVKGLRGVEKDPQQENTSFYAGFTAPYLTIAGSQNIELTVKSYDLPKEMLTSVLGWAEVNGFLADDTSKFDSFAFGFAQMYQTETDSGYKATYYPSVRATSPAESAATDEDKLEAVEYEFTSTVNADSTFKVGGKVRTAIKWEVSEKELETGTTPQAKAFIKLFTSLKKLEPTDIEGGA